MIQFEFFYKLIYCFFLKFKTNLTFEMKTFILMQVNFFYLANNNKINEAELKFFSNIRLINQC